MGWAVVWKNQQNLIVNCCIGHGRVFSGLYCSEWWALYPQIRIRCCVQRQRSAQWALFAVKLWKWYRNMGLNANQCTWLQMGWAVVWKTPKKINCKLLHGAWKGVYRSALQRVMSLMSTNPHQMLPAETAVSPVALLQSSCLNDTESWDSMQVSPPGPRYDEQQFENVKIMWLWHAVSSMGGCIEAWIEASNEPCICIFTLDACGRDNGWTCLATVPPITMDIKADWFM